MTKPDWTPYAHEAARHALIRKRRGVIAAIAILIAGAWFGWTTFTAGESSVNVGTAGGGSQIEFDESSRPEEKPVTVGISPGGTAVMDTALDTSGGAAPQSPPQRPRNLLDEPYSFTNLIVMYGPILGALYFAFRFLRARPGKLDELNFGIYKGSLPLEMLTASNRDYVFTSGYVDESIFGKGKGDYVQEADSTPRRVLFESVSPAATPVDDQ